MHLMGAAATSRRDDMYRTMVRITSVGRTVTCFLPLQAGLQMLSQTMLELETKSNTGSLVYGEVATDRRVVK